MEGNQTLLKGSVQNTKANGIVMAIVPKSSLIQIQHSNSSNRVSPFNGRRTTDLVFQGRNTTALSKSAFWTLWAQITIIEASHDQK